VAVTLRPIAINDIALVDEILDGLQEYSMRVDGVPKMTDGARHLLSATPDGYGHESKHVFAVMSGSEPIGVVDIIRDFPNPSTAFIGLLAVMEVHQRRALGRAAFKAIEEFARCKLKASKLRLAVVATNPVDGFWLKMGFRETGEVKPYSGKHVTSTVHLLEKPLG
jgi:GNAT superfamily N-acetyltransferase